MAASTRHGPLVGLLGLTLGSGWADAVGAQQRTGRGAGAVYLAAGASRIGTGELGQRLATHGYATPGPAALVVGIGGYLVLEGRIMLGGELNGVSLGTRGDAGREVGIDGGFGTASVGYAVAPSPRLRVYPRLGVGAGGLSVSIRRSRDAVNFDEVLADPVRQAALADSARPTVLSHGSVVVDLGAGAELLPGGWGRGLLIGLRVGYLAAPSSTRWGLDQRTVTGGPTTTLAGPYVRLIVGGGPRW